MDVQTGSTATPDTPNNMPWSAHGVSRQPYADKYGEYLLTSVSCYRARFGLTNGHQVLSVLFVHCCPCRDRGEKIGVMGRHVERLEDRSQPVQA